MRLSQIIGIAILIQSLSLFGQGSNSTFPSLNPDLSLDQYNLKTWTSLKDMPASQVWDIAQDETGYLWLATNEGVFRFDGFSFTKYGMANVEAFHSESFNEIEVGKDGQVWVGNANGLYYQEGNTFKEWKSPDGKAPSKIGSMSTDALGKLWFISHGQLFCIDSNEGKTPLPLITNAFTVVRGETGTMWASTLDGRLFSFTENVMTEHAEITAKLDGPIRGIAENKQGELFLGLSTVGLYRWKDGKIEALFPDHKELWLSPSRKLLIDANQALWIASSYGILRISDHKIERFAREEGLTDNRVRSIFADKNGLFWVGTYEGLNSFSEIPVILSKLSGSPDHEVASLHAAFEDSKGNVWATTSSTGLLLRSGNSLVRPNGHGLLPQGIRSIAELSNGNLLLGSNKGLLEVRYEQGAVKLVRKLSDDWITMVFVASNGDIWYNIIQNLIEGSAYKISGNETLKIDWSDNNVGIYWIYEESVNSYWIGTNNGLYHSKSGNIKHYGSEEGLFSTRIMDYWKADTNELWFATGDAGLVQFEDGKFNTFNTKNGFPINKVYDILLDSSGNLWFTSSKAIYKTRLSEFDKAVLNNDFTQFVLEKYAVPSGINNWGFPKTQTGYGGILYFTGAQGLLSIDNEQPNTRPKQLIIESVLVDGKQSDLTQKIILNSTIQNLEIQYTAIDFVTAEDLVFQYKLEGYDRDWQTVGNRRTAYYSGLPSGDLEFKVRLLASGSEDQTASLSLNKKVVWWQSAWAIAIAVIVFLAVLRILWYLRVKSIKAKNLQLQAIVDERTHELQDLTVNLEEKVKERTQELQESSLRLSSALEVSIDDIWDWDLKSDTIEYSPAIYRILGYEQDEIEVTRQTFIDFRHPDSEEPDTQEEQYARARKIGTYTFTSVFQLKHKQGHYIWMQTKGKAIAWDENGLATRLVGTNTDITAEKKKEQEMLEAVLTTEDNERGRISREIHDGLQQTLTISSLNLEYVKRELNKLGPLAQEKFNTGWTHLQQSITESRNVAHALMPKAINDYGLVSAIESLVDDLNNIAEKIEFLFDHNVVEQDIENQAIEVSFYRIVQEASNNIIKHAQATRVMIQFKSYDDVLMLTVEDNGKGFNLEEMRKNGRVFGLKTMENRIAAIAGHIEVDTRPGRGTSIIVQVPKDKFEGNGSTEIDAG